MPGRHVAADHGTPRQARMIQTDETDETFHHPADMDGHHSKVIEVSPPRSQGRIGPLFIERGGLGTTSRYVGVIVEISFAKPSWYRSSHG
jgi:hypothetical protein